MYRRDLSKFYNYEPCNIYNVGFLHPGKNYVKGAVDALLLPKLVSIQKREQVNLMRSYPCCYLDPCDGCRALLAARCNPEIEIANDFLAHEIWVPSADGSCIYMAPSALVHYINDHQYQPPAEFVEAILSFDLNSAWSGEIIRNKFENEYFAVR